MTFWNPTRLIALNFYPFNFDLALNWELDSTSTGPSFGCLMWPLGGASFTAPISPIFLLSIFAIILVVFRATFSPFFPVLVSDFQHQFCPILVVFQGHFSSNFCLSDLVIFDPFFGLFGPNFHPFRHISIISAPFFGGFGIGLPKLELFYLVRFLIVFNCFIHFFQIFVVQNFG